MNELQEAPRVDIASIEKDLARSPQRYARRLMRVVVRPKLQPMPGGYVCEQGESVIAVPENKVASVLAMAATQRDREDLQRAQERFAEEIERARASGLAEGTEGFSVMSLFRQVAGHDYPALDFAEVIADQPSLPPEQLLSEQRAQRAQAEMLATVVKAAMFEQPDGAA
jgi:hypothetical protein